MNSSHFHKEPGSDQQVEAFGLREHCNPCRKVAGLPQLSETDLKLVKAAAKTSSGSGAEPVEQLLADLKEQEEINDSLRAQLKEKDAELAQLRTQLAALEKKKS